MVYILILDIEIFKKLTLLWHDIYKSPYSQLITEDFINENPHYCVPIKLIDRIKNRIMLKDTKILECCIEHLSLIFKYYNQSISKYFDNIYVLLRTLLGSSQEKVKSNTINLISCMYQSNDNV